MSSSLRFARHFQIIMPLSIHPELRTIAKIQAQPKRDISGDAPTIISATRFGEIPMIFASRLCDRAYSPRNAFSAFRCKFIVCHRHLLSMLIHDPKFIRYAISMMKLLPNIAELPYAKVGQNPMR